MKCDTDTHGDGIAGSSFVRELALLSQAFRRPYRQAGGPFCGVIILFSQIFLHMPGGRARARVQVGDTGARTS